MNRTQSQPNLLYELEAITIGALHTNGVTLDLECTDEGGKTPLILACTDSALFHVAKFLIELGANVNAFCPANALVRNDNKQTPLDVARSQRHAYVVRAIEKHICYFKGWMREFSGPWFLEAVTPQLVSRNVWVVVVPYSEEPLKLEIIIYPTQQDSQPRTVIDLWKSKIEEPTFDQCDSKLKIFNHFPWTRCRLASAIENDQQQLQRLYSACRGIPQVEPPQILSDAQASLLDASQPTEVLKLAMSSGASVQSEAINTNGWGSSGDSSSYNGWGTSLGTKHSLEENTNGWTDKQVKDDYNGWGLIDSKPVDQLTENNLGSSGDSSSYNGWGTSLEGRHSSEVNTNGWMDKPINDDYNGWGLLDSEPVDYQLTENVQSHDNNSPVVSLASCSSAFALSVPSALPIPDEVLSEGPIHYPSINSSPFDMPVPSMVEAGMSNSRNNSARDSSCAICWDASTQGACIPCGHMAGCMPCLNEIKVKRGFCPICLTKIDQVVRLYAV